MKDMIRTTAPFLLILLFVYAASSKLLTPEDFRQQLYRQAFSQRIADILRYTLPPLELLTAALLAFAPTRRAGLVLSALLLLSFSVYIALAMLHYWNRAPCPCGGVLTHMPWWAHLALNLGLASIALAALIIMRAPKKN